MCRWKQLMINILQAEETNHNPKIQNAGHNQESCWIHFYGPHIYGRNWWHPNAPLAAMTRGAISSHPDARCNTPDHLEREGVYSSVGLLRQPNNYAMWVLIKILGEPHILIFLNSPSRQRDSQVWTILIYLEIFQQTTGLQWVSLKVSVLQPAVVHRWSFLKGEVLC